MNSSKYKYCVVTGAFDVIHPGHILLLKEAAKRATNVIVLLQDDPTIDRDWKNKPIQTIDERKMILSSIKYVDKIITYNTEKELIELLFTLCNKYKDEIVRLLGSEYRDGIVITGRDIMNLEFHTRNHEWSSSEMKQRILSRGTIKPSKK